MITIQSLIDDYFDFNYFWQIESESRNLIDRFAEDFEAKHPNVIKNIINNGRGMFPSVTFRRYTYFVKDDRCLTFEISFSENKSIICAISIFGYFLAWNEYQLTENIFDNYIYKGENELIDKVFNNLVKPEFIEDLEWVSKDMLSLEIEKFNLGRIPDAGDHPIYVGDMLTRFNLI